MMGEAKQIVVAMIGLGLILGALFYVAPRLGLVDGSMIGRPCPVDRPPSLGCIASAGDYSAMRRQRAMDEFREGYGRDRPFRRAERRDDDYDQGYAPPPRYGRR